MCILTNGAILWGLVFIGAILLLLKRSWLTNLFKKDLVQSDLVQSELDRVKKDLRSSYSREDLWRNRYNKIRAELTDELDLKILVIDKYSKQNLELQKQIFNLETQLIQQNSIKYKIDKMEKELTCAKGHLIAT